MKTIYIECAMGAAGDMLMSALYELLDNQDEFIHTLNHLGLDGVKFLAQQKESCGITGTGIQVLIGGEEEHSLDHHQGQGHNHKAKHSHTTDHDHSHDSSEHGHIHIAHKHSHSHENHHEHRHDHAHSHTSLQSVFSIIENTPLPAKVKEEAKKVYQNIAQAEGKVHGCEPEQVHFHEVGSLDAIADILGVCYAMHLLQPDQVIVSPIHVGYGQVRCQHGVVPVPAPATALLLTGAPIYSGAVEGELCTPTGAALLQHFAGSYGNIPVMKVEKIGYGVGKKTFPAANCVRVFYGHTADFSGSSITEITCTIDDMPAEALGFASKLLLEKGALDVYTTPIQMKKNRPGISLTVLCNKEAQQTVIEHIFAHTTTNGLRVKQMEKHFLQPSFTTVHTQYGEISIKVSKGYGTCHVKPEYDQIEKIAKQQGLSFETVWMAAYRAYAENNPTGASHE